jgi:hypothetical protein
VHVVLRVRAVASGREQDGVEDRQCHPAMPRSVGLHEEVGSTVAKEDWSELVLAEQQDLGCSTPSPSGTVYFDVQPAMGRDYFLSQL